MATAAPSRVSSIRVIASGTDSDCGRSTQRNSPLIRRKTVAHLRLLGLQLDDAANLRCIRGVAGEIQASGSPRVLVVPTNEELQIALDTLNLIQPHGAAHA